MTHEPQTTTDEKERKTVTADADDLVFALEMNATHSADDRVLAVPQRDGASAKVRRKFTGTERYSNPSTAPAHIRPEWFIEDGFERPPKRSQVDTDWLDVPERIDERDEDDRQRIDDAHAELMDTWKTDVRGMLTGDHEFEAKDTAFKLMIE